MENDRKRFEKKEILLIILMIAAFAATRQYTWFNNYLMLDDVDHYLEARRIFSSFAIPVTGPALAGTGARIPGGGYYLLLAPPSLLAGDPLSFSVYTGILMICASIFFLAMVRRHYGKTAMLVTSSLLLFSPRMMLMESGTWNPYYSVIISLVMAGLLLEIFSGGDRPVLMFLILPLAALMAQTHFTSFFYLPLILAAYFIFFYRGKNALYFWLGLAGALSLYLPYLVSEAGNHFQNTAAILSMRGPGGFSFPVLSYLLLFASVDFMMSGYMSEGFRFLACVPWYASWPVIPVYFTSLILPAAAFLYCMAKLFRKGVLRDIDRSVIIFFLLILGGLIFAFSVFGIPSYPTHYYLPVYAFSFFPAIVLIRGLEQRLPVQTGFAAVSRVLCVLFIAAGSIISVYYFSLVIRPFSISRQYGYINAILDDSRGRPFTVRTEYEKAFYDITAREVLHRDWNEKDGAALSYVIDMKENLTNDMTYTLIYGDGLMGVYKESRVESRESRVRSQKSRGWPAK